jgi:8-oxo-dGTP diphosphatase
MTWPLEEQGALGGLYTFCADVPDEVELLTPREMPEGILDWKPLEWILHPMNNGVAPSTKYFLPAMLRGQWELQHHFTFHKGVLTDYIALPLDAGIRRSVS